MRRLLSSSWLRRRLEHVGPRTFTGFTDLPAPLVIALVVASAVGTWQVAILAGGAKTPVPHLFYLAIILAAVRFGYRAALLTALFSGMLAGPLLAADTLTDEPQPAVGWLTRLGIFIVVGLFVAFITSHTRPNLLTTGRDAIVGREIREAVHAGHIHVHYQPLVELATGRPIGVEALVRWQHPEQGTRSPAEFVPVAERTGVIKALDTTVMHEAIRQLADWDHQGSRDLTMSVNVSAQWFHDPGLVDTVADLLSHYRIRPERLHVELTETAILADTESIAVQIAALRRIGVRVAIDDFGAGQTSLSYLHRFGIDVVKIDRDFITDITDATRVSRLVGGMVRLFDAMDVTVVSEGIETAEQYQHVRSLGAHVGQGYYIAKPATAQEVTSWLMERSRRAHARSRPGEPPRL